MLTDRYTSGDTEPKTGDTGVGPASDGKRLTAVIRGRSVQAPQQEHVIVIGRNRAERVPCRILRAGRSRPHIGHVRGALSKDPSRKPFLF